MAQQGTSAPSASSYLAHAVVASGLSDLGLDDATAAASGATDASVAAHMAAPAETVEPIQRPLGDLVADHMAVEVASTEQDCLANAVYFEARGESVEGQLAVAEVVLNRAQSGRYPATVCGVVRQRAQFSFVRRGVIPRADRASEAWRRAVAVARIAQAGATRLLPQNVLWYHANYVNPVLGPAARAQHPDRPAHLLQLAPARVRADACPGAIGSATTSPGRGCGPRGSPHCPMGSISLSRSAT